MISIKLIDSNITIYFDKVVGFLETLLLIEKKRN